MAVDATELRAQTAAILAHWAPETITVNRLGSSVSYDSEGQATTDAAANGTVTGHWHCKAGEFKREEVGSVIKFDAYVIVSGDGDVLEADDLVRADSSVYTVVFVQVFTGHKTVFCRRHDKTES